MPTNSRAGYCSRDEYPIENMNRPKCFNCQEELRPDESVCRACGWNAEWEKQPPSELTSEPTMTVEQQVWVQAWCAVTNSERSGLAEERADACLAEFKKRFK